MEKEREEDMELILTDIQNKGELIVFSEMTHKFYEWRTSASGGLHLDPGLGENDPSNKRRRDRAEKDKSNLFRLLQVPISFCFNTVV